MWILSVSFLSVLAIALADEPCAQRTVDGESVVCVCNATYCDTITQTTPSSGGFVAYVTSKEGERFNKTEGTLVSADEGDSKASITVDLSSTYQEMLGFGGAITDAAGINWLNLTEDIRQKLIESYFSADGLEYNFLRIPIGGCDFSTYAYAYNELPENDADLTNYTLTMEDYTYKIPMIKAALDAATRDVRIVATTWSPPLWMKTNNAWYGISRLKDEYLGTYAQYHYKFLELYKAQNISIWGITATNEPLNGVLPLSRFNSLGWSHSTYADWIAEELGPLIRNSTEFNATKILIGDDQRYTLPTWVTLAAAHNSKMMDYVDGIGVHYYGDFITPSLVLDAIHDENPSKFILGTEASNGYLPWQRKVIKGSWDRAVSYVENIIVDINNYVTGWIDWNLCLNEEGGPNWAENYVDSTILVNAEDQEFLKQPMFYAMGHFSKFVPPGSVRVGHDISGWHLKGTAFTTPNNTTVAVLYNSGGERNIAVKSDSKQAILKMPAKSIATIEIRTEDLQ